jgi:hypothetical protein
MVPSAFVIPAVLPPGFLGALLEPAGVLSMLAAITVAVSLGLCVAIATGRAPRAGSVHSFPAARRRTAERDAVAA